MEAQTSSHPNRIPRSALMLACAALCLAPSRAQCPAVAGLFSASASTTPTQSATTLATADFNDDGVPDLLVGGFSNIFQVLLGTGSGTFLPPISVPLPGGIFGRFAAAGDINGDGIVDLAAGGAVSTVGPGLVSILYGVGSSGVGTGTFSVGPIINLLPAPGFSSVGSPYSVRIADLNNDGIPDIIGVNTGSISVHLGQGTAGRSNGTYLALPAVALAGGASYDLAVRDFNGDGILDAAIIHGAGSMEVLIGQGANGVGTGVLVSTQVIPIAVSGLLTMVAADFDGDQILDLAVPDGASTGSVLVFRGAGTGGIGNGTFAAPTAYPVGNYPSFVRAADFNGDGIADLLVDRQTAITTGGNHAVSLLISQPPGGFAPYIGLVAAGGGLPWGNVALDLNGDRAPDISIAKQIGQIDTLFGTCVQTSSAVPGVITPAPGVTWAAGSNQTISWTKPSFVPTVDVEVSRDGGVNWEMIVESSTKTSYVWHVTNPSSTRGMIRVRDSAAWSRAGTSQLFSIAGAWTPSATAFGTGCGLSIPALSLNTPLIGFPVIITLSGATASAPAALFAGVPANVPQVIGPGCSLAFDPSTAVPVVDFATDAAGGWSLAFPLPLEPRLVGLDIGLQAAVIAPATPPGFQVSAGVRALIGY